VDPQQERNEVRNQHSCQDHLANHQQDLATPVEICQLEDIVVQRQHLIQAETGLGRRLRAERASKARWHRDQNNRKWEMRHYQLVVDADLDMTVCGPGNAYVQIHEKVQIRSSQRGRRLPESCRHLLPSVLLTTVNNSEANAVKTTRFLGIGLDPEH
jgi:hypothetical protein